MEQQRSKEMVKELPIEGLFLKEMTNKEAKKNYLMKGQNWQTFKTHFIFWM